MKTLKQHLIKKSLITWVALCCVALMTTSCFYQKKASTSGEEKVLVEGESKSPSLNPSVKNWSGLAAICGKANNSEAEQLVCKLDDLLDEVAKSGKPLSDFENDIKIWIQAAVDLQDQICKNDKEITFLVIGTMKVLEGRNLISLPFVAATVTVSSSVNFYVRKIIYAAVIKPVQSGCSIDQVQLKKVLDLISNSAGNGGGTVAPNPGAGNGGGTVAPNPGNGNPVNAVCFQLQSNYKKACKPSCEATNSCNDNKCQEVTKLCSMNSCQCN